MTRVVLATVLSAIAATTVAWGGFLLTAAVILTRGGLHGGANVDGAIYWLTMFAALGLPLGVAVGAFVLFARWMLSAPLVPSRRTALLGGAIVGGSLNLIVWAGIQPSLGLLLVPAGACAGAVGGAAFRTLLRHDMPQAPAV
jgi:hypothetical protein